MVHVVQTKDDLLRELAEEIKQKDTDLERATEKLEVRSNVEHSIYMCCLCVALAPRHTNSQSHTK